MAKETNGGAGSAKESRAKKLNVLGAKLKELREAQEISLQTASDATKIQKKYISAIEAGELGALPKGPYCRSFLRQYCAYLNAPDMWTKYDPLTRGRNVMLADAASAREEPDMSVTPGVFRSSPRFWIYLLAAVSIAAACWVTLRCRGEISTSATTPLEGGTAPIAREQREKRGAPADDGDYNVPPLSPDAAASVDLGWMDGKQPALPARQASAPVQAKAGQAPEQRPKAKEPSLTLTARADSWLRVSEGANVLYQGILKPGGQKTFRASEAAPLRVRCGNPSGTEAAWFGAAPKLMSGGKNPVTKYYWSDGAITDTDKR